MRRGPMASLGAPTEKALDFRGTLRRLSRRLRRDRVGLVAVAMLAVVSVTLSVLGPRLLGRATDVIFHGVIGNRMRSDESKAEAVARLRRSGDGRLADMVAGLDIVPGRGIDFGDLRNVLLGALALYVGAAACSIEGSAHKQPFGYGECS